MPTPGIGSEDGVYEYPAGASVGIADTKLSESAGFSGDTPIDSALAVLVPQTGQNFALFSSSSPHFGQTDLLSAGAGAAAAHEAPQLGQNFASSGIILLHFVQIISVSFLNNS